MRPGFKSSGCILKLCTLKSDVFNHISATLPGLHLIQEIFLPIDNADARRSENLVSGEYKKIRIQRLKVHAHV